jgi:Co/Zn/Cd efflux system component
MSAETVLIKRMDMDRLNYPHDHDFLSSHQHRNERRTWIVIALTSILAITALLFGKYQGWNFLDPVMGIVGAVVISRWSYGLLRETGKVLLDYSDPTLVEEGIRRIVASEADAVLLDLHVWRVGPGSFSAIVALRAGNAANPVHLRKRLCDIHNLDHVTIEINPPATTMPGEAVACPAKDEIL